MCLRDRVGGGLRRARLLNGSDRLTRALRLETCARLSCWRRGRLWRVARLRFRVERVGLIFGALVLIEGVGVARTKTCARQRASCVDVDVALDLGAFIRRVERLLVRSRRLRCACSGGCQLWVDEVVVDLGAFVIVEGEDIGGLIERGGGRRSDAMADLGRVALFAAIVFAHDLAMW